MKRKSLKIVPFIFVAFLLGNCNLPRVTISQATDTPIPATATLDSTTPLPSAELGSAENPLILVLSPTATTPEQINAAHQIAAQFSERTGYVVLTTVADSNTALIEALENGNAHIVLLDPLTYALAYQDGLAQARFAQIKDDEYKYGAQFLAALKDGYKTHFDPSTGLNTSDPEVALAQFQDKKPCWSEENSPSGYVVPLGVLNQNQIVTKPPAFVGGQPTVVRSLYVGGICDFGATYIDARKFPSLEDSMPDLMQKVGVIWEVPEVIPYEVVAFSTRMPQHMRDLFASLIPAIQQTDAGKTDFKTAFDIEQLQPVNDGDFAEFHSYIKDSLVDLPQIIDP